MIVYTNSDFDNWLLQRPLKPFSRSCIILNTRPLWGKHLKFRLQGAQQDTNLHIFLREPLKSTISGRGWAASKEIERGPFLSNSVQSQPLNRFDCPLVKMLILMYLCEPRKLIMRLCLRLSLHPDFQI